MFQYEIQVQPALVQHQSTINQWHFLCRMKRTDYGTRELLWLFIPLIKKPKWSWEHSRGWKFLEHTATWGVCELMTTSQDSTTQGAVFSLCMKLKQQRSAFISRAIRLIFQAQDLLKSDQCVISSDGSKARCSRISQDTQVPKAKRTQKFQGWKCPAQWAQSSCTSPNVGDIPFLNPHCPSINFRYKSVHFMYIIFLYIANKGKVRKPRHFHFCSEQECIKFTGDTSNAQKHNNQKKKIQNVACIK